MIVVRDQATREALAKLTTPAPDGMPPSWETVRVPGIRCTHRTRQRAEIAATDVPSQFTAPLHHAAVVLVICVNLEVVAALDQDLDRIGVISGASIYPLVWNILLAARNEGFGGTITTHAVAEEPRVRELLGVPESYAVAAVLPLGKPRRQLTKLKRNSVAELATRERFDGEPFSAKGCSTPGSACRCFRRRRA